MSNNFERLAIKHIKIDVIIKAAPCDDVNFDIIVAYEIEYPADHGFIFYNSDLKKYFYQHCWESLVNLNRLFVHLKDGLMLVQHMATCLLTSAQRWADNRGCLQSRIPQTHSQPRRWLWSTLDNTVWDGGIKYLWYKVLHNAHSFVYMAI